MNRRVAEKIRDIGCRECRLGSEVEPEEVCVTGSGNRRAEIMVVSKVPNSRIWQENLEEALKGAGLDPAAMFFTGAVKCRDYEANATKTSVKACKPFLEAEIDIVKPKWILTLGNEALQSVTGNSGIMKHRGRLIAHASGATVIPTISPSAVQRNPGQRQSYIADLNFFAAQVMGKPAKVDKPKMAMVKTKKQLKAVKKLLEMAHFMAFDIETYSSTGDEFGKNPRIISLSFTLVTQLTNGEEGVITVCIPLCHKDSPFKRSWRSVLKYLAPAMCQVPKRVAHNGKFDCRWLNHHGVPIYSTYDTMLAAHLLDENRLKGLKPQATSRFGVEQWSLDAKDLRNHDLAEILVYNGLDTYYTYHLYEETRAELLKERRLLRIFMKLLMPADRILIDVERRGVWMDREKLASHTKIAFDMRDEIDRQLETFLPQETVTVDPGLPSGGVQFWEWPTYKNGKPCEVNWNPSIFLRWFLFEHLDLPVINRGKEKDDGSLGDPSVAESVMMELKNYAITTGIAKEPIRLLMERSKWQKYCSAFLSAYQELLDDHDRIHTTFKLYGTVTGRLSSGKADADKISGRPSLRGVNLQQVPRDPFIRGLFGAAPGHTFVEADFSQVELRVAAYLSRDRTMLHLYQTGQDIHRATAAWVLGRPASLVTADDRKKAKAVNFGFVYGMGARKFVKTAFEKYELDFSEEEAQAIRKTFFAQFPGLLSWHARQRRLVGDYGRVQSPIGRVRHLPDIESSDSFVRGEAERQAINSPVQSFASDMTLLSMVLLQEIFWEKGLNAHFISTVHDALLFEVADKDVADTLPIIKDVMENLPLKKKFGAEIDVPIVVDIKVGKYWGESKELTSEEVHSWTSAGS